MVLLLQTVREALDAYGNSLNVPYNFTLTAASPAGPSSYQALHLADMDQYIDFWNLMAYDYAGSWSTLAANQANLFSSGSNAAATPFDTQTAINYYTLQGIAANKIALGMPVYGRSFEATEGLGKPFNGVGNGTWEAGVYDFKALPLSGATEFNDSTTGSSYSYDIVKKELVSYDTVLVAKQKAAWIQQMGLGGAMWWESSADGVGNNSLIRNVVEVFGGDDGSGLQSSPNQLLYPNSTYDNLRAGMPGSSSVSATMPTSTGSMSEACLCASLSTSSVLTASLPSEAVPASDTSSGSVTTSTSTATTSGTTQSTTIVINDASTSSTTGSSFCSEVSSTDTITEVASDQPPQSSITTALIVPGKNGVPGCAYVLASDLGAGALCSSDYCNCGGTIALLLTSSVSGTLSINCNYQTQPTANSCPPSSSITSTTALTTNVPIFYTSTVLGPPTTVTSIIVVSERGTRIPGSDSASKPTSASTVVPACLSHSTLAAAASSTFPSSTDIFPLSAYSNGSTSCSTAQTSSTSGSVAAQSPFPSDLPSSTSSSHPSTTISSSVIPPQVPLFSTTSGAEPSTSSSDCAIGGTCSNYKVLACPSGECACGQDVNNVPTCFLNKDCAVLLKCKTSDDCGASKACIVNTCCGNGGYCAQLAVGCLTSPAWTSTVRAAPICGKIKNRSISALGGGGIGPRVRC
jgi:hypothetical protein